MSKQAVQLTLSLDEIAADIHKVWAETKAHQIGAWEGYFRVGADLKDAKSRLPKKNDYGVWFDEQQFGFSLSWGTRLRTLANNEAAARELIGSGLPISVDEIVKALRANRLRDRDRRARAITVGGSDASGDGWAIIAGTFQQAPIPDAWVDLIITDPPYPEESAKLWDDLAAFAMRVLVPGGLLLALSGKIHVDDRMDRLRKGGLAYGWMYAQPLPGSNTRILGRHVVQEWKPWLCYSKGAWPSGRINWHGDLLKPDANTQGEYEWQQQLGPAVELIKRLSQVNDIVVDPFCGSGTYGVAAVQTGRQFIGVEVDSNRVGIAVRRLQDAQKWLGL